MTMKICFIVGDHLRHNFIFNQVARRFDVSATVVVGRGAMLPDSDDMAADLKALHDLHFTRRLEAERRHFGEEAPLWRSKPRMQVGMEALNSAEVIRFLGDHAPDLLITWGVPILERELLEGVPGEKWNIHGGLSPWYRGTITHFWPSYMLEPQMTGMTVHRITPQVDGGEIVHQCVAPLVAGDGLHDLGCRAVLTLAGELGVLVERFAAGKPMSVKPQRTTGKIWRTSDWQPSHLRLIYQLYQDRVVDAYLRGEFGRRQPVIFRGNLEG